MAFYLAGRSAWRDYVKLHTPALYVDITWPKGIRDHAALSLSLDLVTCGCLTSGAYFWTTAWHADSNAALPSQWFAAIQRLMLELRKRYLHENDGSLLYVVGTEAAALLRHSSRTYRLFVVFTGSVSFKLLCLTVSVRACYTYRVYNYSMFS